MANPLGALMTSSLLFLVVFALPNHVHAEINTSWKHAAPNNVGGADKTVPIHQHTPFTPGQWKQAYATFYEGGSGTFGIYINIY